MMINQMRCAKTSHALSFRVFVLHGNSTKYRKELPSDTQHSNCDNVPHTVATTSDMAETHLRTLFAEKEISLKKYIHKEIIFTDATTKRSNWFVVTLCCSTPSGLGPRMLPSLLCGEIHRSSKEEEKQPEMREASRRNLRGGAPCQCSISAFSLYVFIHPQLQALHCRPRNAHHTVKTKESFSSPENWLPCLVLHCSFQ